MTYPNPPKPHKDAVILKALEADCNALLKLINDEDAYWSGCFNTLVVSHIARISEYTELYFKVERFKKDNES